ncbi:hypothetical protein [Marinobacterium sp. BA1]|uniref:hypothetical protein n=1 Tax=Marinobacterium sp. BA1 TaxID=3138931 RepID=UPI0032E65295
MKLEDVKIEIANAPTIPSKDETWCLIDKLLSVSDLEINTELEFSDALLNLINKASEIYEPITEEQTEKSIFWMSKIWDEDNAELADSILTISANIAPNKSKVFLNDLLEKSKNNEIRVLIKETIQEL